MPPDGTARLFIYPGRRWPTGGLRAARYTRVVDLPDSFVRAVTEGRFRDAATDGALHARWTDKRDALARALLILAAAHFHAGQANAEGARIKLGRAVRYLERLPLDPYAAVLLDHARESLSALAQGRDLPRMPLGFR